MTSIEELTEESSVADVCFALVANGFSEEAVNCFADNEVDGFSLFSLTDADLKDILPGKVGLVRKLVLLLEKGKASRSVSEILQPFPTDNRETTDNDDVLPTLPPLPPLPPLHDANTDYPQQNHRTLPKYSERVMMSLDKGEIVADMDVFVEETAYHVLATGDMSEKTDYEDYGRRLVAKYPCLAFVGHRQPWSFINRKISQKVRHVRWLRRKRLQKGPAPSKRHRPAILIASTEDGLSAEESELKLGEELQVTPRNLPLLKKLFRASTSVRRRKLSKVEDGAVRKMGELCPLLLDAEFILMEFQSLMKKPRVSVEDRFNELMSTLDLMLMGALEENDMIDDDDTKPEVDVILGLQSKLAFKAGKGTKMEPAISVIESMDLDLESRPKTPPRLLIVKHQNAPHEAYVVADSINVKCTGETLLDFLRFLFACYYAWDLSYPKQYQVLGFLQIYLLQDTDNSIVRGTNFVKFEKTFLDKQ